MNSCSIGEGTNVKIELVAPPKGYFVKLRLHNSKEFSKLNDPKAVLEKIMSRDYPVVTQGQTIALHYPELDKVFMIDIIETQPTEIIEIINVDINVDFDRALDYEEAEASINEARETSIPHKPNQDISGSTIHQNRNINKYKKTDGFVAFSGKGNLLGRK